MSDCIPPEDIITATEVRELCRIKTRQTLLNWQRDRGFPPPFRQLPGAAGGLWDRREVRAWLKQQRRRGT